MPFPIGGALSLQCLSVKNGCFSLATVVFFFVVPKDARAFLLFVGQGRPIPALSSLYGKALCFLLIHSVRVNVVRQSRRFFFVTSGILLLLFPAMITRFHFPISCHDRRASVLKWEHGGGTFLLLFVTVAPFIYF